MCKFSAFDAFDKASKKVFFSWKCFWLGSLNDCLSKLGESMSPKTAPTHSSIPVSSIRQFLFMHVYLLWSCAGISFITQGVWIQLWQPLHATTSAASQAIYIYGYRNSSIPLNNWTKTINHTTFCVPVCSCVYSHIYININIYIWLYTHEHQVCLLLSEIVIRENEMAWTAWIDKLNECKFFLTSCVFRAFRRFWLLISGGEVFAVPKTKKRIV